LRPALGQADHQVLCATAPNNGLPASGHSPLSPNWHAVVSKKKGLKSIIKGKRTCANFGKPWNVVRNIAKIKIAQYYDLLFGITAVRLNSKKYKKGLYFQSLQC
jgi:hypothetical protein